METYIQQKALRSVWSYKVEFKASDIYRNNKEIHTSLVIFAIDEGISRDD